MTTAAMNNLWNYIQGLNLSQRNRTWLAERLQEPKVQDDAHSVAERLCTSDEYSQLEKEGFLNCPHVPYQAMTDENIIAEVSESHASGYMSSVDSEDFMRRLEAL